MKRLLTASTMLVLSTSIFAGNPNSGCGLGSIIIKNQDTKIMQIIAVTTNGTSGNQTFGITSGTLGCDGSSQMASNTKLNRFVADNMDELALDISNGKGETLNTLASLLNVKNTSAFGTKLQSNFSKIYTSEAVTAANVIDSIVEVTGV